MNYYLIVSGILLVVMSIAHSVIGEIRVISPLKNTHDLPLVSGSVHQTKLTLRFTWHLTTVLGVGISVILLYYSGFQTFSTDQIFVLRIFAFTFFISFLVSLIGSRAKHPSWIIFFIVAVMIWLSASYS
jgi:hypothetical protein